MNTHARLANGPGRASLSIFPCIAAWGFMILTAVLAIMELAAPQPSRIEASESEFSAARAMLHVRAMTHSPHPTGSAANESVRQYLLAQLTTLGMNPQVFTAIGVDDDDGDVAIGKTNNIVGRLSGTGNSRAILLMAHYDSVDLAPGAGDDSAGVASILETVRALRTGPPLKNDLIVLFTDGEEAGMLGADAFTASHPWMRDIGLVMNFEGRGNQGASLLFETSANNARVIQEVGEAAPHPVGSSLFYALYKLLPNDTDFTRFRPSETPGLNFAFGAGLEAYHSQLDTAENLSPGSLQHHGSYALSLTRRFGQMDLTQLKNNSGDAVFFDWLGSHLVWYAERWVVPGELLATILLILAIVLLVRKSEVKLSRILIGLVPSVFILLAIPLVLGAAGWLLIRFLGAHLLTSDSPANAGLLTGLVLLGICTGNLLLAGFRKRFSVHEIWLSGLIVVCFLSWVVGLMLPAGSYLLFWPFLFMNAGLLGVALMKKRIQPFALSVGSLVGTAICVLLFAPLIYLLYIFLTLQIVTIVAVGAVLGLSFLLCIPMMNLAVPERGWRLITLLVLIGAVFALGVGAKLSHYSAEHPRRDSILYSLNADDRTAAWISTTALDDWTEQFFSNKPVQRRAALHYLAGSQRPVLSTPAPPLDLLPPIAALESDTKQDDVRTIHLNVRSQRNAGTVTLIFRDAAKPLLVRSGDREVRSSPYRITLYGLDAHGATIELSFKSSSRISFWLVDHSDGLPGNVRPRPSNLVAGYGSDEIMISREYSF